MGMEKFFREVREIEEAVSEWVASDGGLTIAASDILAACQYTRKELESLKGLTLKELTLLQREIEGSPYGDPYIDDLEGITLRAVDREIARRTG